MFSKTNLVVEMGPGSRLSHQNSQMNPADNELTGNPLEAPTESNSPLAPIF